MTENRNIYALIHCILSKTKPETAMNKFGISTYNSEEKQAQANKRRTRNGITLEDVKGMFEMKEEGWTYREIGEYFGKSDGAIHKIMQRNKKYVSGGVI